MWVVATRIKAPMGKKPQLITLGAEVPSTGTLHNYHVVKCVNRKLLFTVLGIDPGPLEADERAPSRCTTSAPSVPIRLRNII